MREAKFSNYRPKRWHPEFDLIVIDSINGLNNKELGDKYGYTPQHISNILSTEEAGKVKERIRGAINKEFEGALQDKLAGIGEKVVKHLETFIVDENDLAGKSPFNFIDRAIKIGEAVGVVGKKNAGGDVNIGRALIISSDQAAGIKHALMAGSELDKVEPVVRPEEVEYIIKKVG